MGMCVLFFKHKAEPAQRGAGGWISRVEEEALAGPDTALSVSHTGHIQLWFVPHVVTCQVVPQVTQQQEAAAGKASLVSTGIRHGTP